MYTIGPSLIAKEKRRVEARSELEQAGQRSTIEDAVLNIFLKGLLIVYLLTAIRLDQVEELVCEIDGNLVFGMNLQLVHRVRVVREEGEQAQVTVRQEFNDLRVQIVVPHLGIYHTRRLN